MLDKEKAIPVRVALEAAKSRSRPELKTRGGERWEMARTEDGTKLAKKDEVQDAGRILNVDKKKQRRTNAYLVDRIRRDAPGVFEAMELGEYPSIQEVATAAGLGHLVITQGE
jgi:hypothetical protein